MPRSPEAILVWGGGEFHHDVGHTEGLCIPDRSAHACRSFLGVPQDEVVIVGEVTGEGPWKVGGCVITVLGCQGTDPELALPYLRWRDYLEQAGPEDYPPQAQIRDIARRLGAAV